MLNIFSDNVALLKYLNFDCHLLIVHMNAQLTQH